MQCLFLTDLQDGVETILAGIILPKTVRLFIHATINRGSSDEIDFSSDGSVKSKGYNGVLFNSE